MNGQKVEVRTLEGTGVKPMCDSVRESVLYWNEGRWAVGSLGTEVRERELRAVNCVDLETK